MFGIGFGEVVAVLVVLIGLVTVVVRRAGADVPPVPVSVAREWRLVQATRVTGALLGTLVAAYVGFAGFERGPMLAPAVFGLILLTATALGETVVRPRRDGGRRTASLVPRRIGDYLPKTLTVMVGLVSVAAVVTLAVTTATAGGRTGRALTCSGPGSLAVVGPYPGSFYTLPLAALLCAVAAVAAIAAIQVVRRPRGMASTDDGDDVLRRRSLRVIVASAGIAVCAPLTGVALVAGSALRSLGGQGPVGCAPAWTGPVGSTMGPLAVAAFFVGCVCLAQLASGSPTRERRVATVAPPP